MAEEFNAIAELRELSYKFVAYISTFPEYVCLLENYDLDLDVFFQEATEEEKEKLSEASKVINDCEEHLSDLQSKMIDLGHMKFTDET